MRVHPRSRVTSIALAFALALSACATETAPEVAPPPAMPAAAAPEPAPMAAAKPVDPADQPLPIDKRIKVGKLANGLTYYILPHRKPEKRAYFWLAVNAGSVLEDDDQRGLAHFVEHMGFNGTKRFPKQDLVNFLERMGVKFGADLNAYTSFDETVYMLQVPTDKVELVDKALQVLRDWAGDVSFDPTEVEKERGVVLEEWRLGRGAFMRIFDKQAPVLFHGSKYADRITIGKPEIIKGAPREALVRFYKDFYRPDLMAVVAVGDFETADIEKKIAAEFGDLKSPAKPRPRPHMAMPSHKDTLVSVETDTEMPNASVQVLNKMPHRPQASERDYRRMLGEQLYGAMINARLDELRRKPGSPFLFAFAGTNPFVRTTDAFARTAYVKEDAVEPGLATLLEEVVRVEKHGFRQTELDRAKKDMLRNFEQSVVQRDKRDGREFASEIVRNFLQAETMPGIETEKALAEKLLPTFTIEELDGLAKTWGGAENRVLAVAGPAKMKKPAPDGLLAIVRAAQQKNVKAYEDAVSSAPLLASAPKAGKITAERKLPDIGVVEWKLSNGTRVVWKSTDYRFDEVRFSAFSPGGHSLAKDADFESAQFSDDVVNEAGLGPFDAVQLRKALTGKIANVSPRVSELEEGFWGSGSPTDLETMMQLVHLYFTAPRRDPAAFEAWKARETEFVRNRRLMPEVVFYEDMQLLLSQNHKRRQPVTPEMLAKVDLDRALASYRDRFAEAGDFTFTFVGNLEPDKLRPLVETYLASLPTRHRKEKWRDVGVKWPKGAPQKTVVKGREPKSMVMIAFHGNEKWTRDTDNDMRMLGEVLRIRLREVLREDMGGVYGVGANGTIARRPKQEYRFTVNFGCSPDNVDKLKQAVFDEIKALQDKGIGDDTIGKVKEARIRAHEVNLRENGFWERELSRAWNYGDDPKLIPDIKPMVDKITSDRVKAAARKYLHTETAAFGVLKPEAVVEAAPVASPAN